MTQSGYHRPRILYFAEADTGGIAEYVLYHARALQESGAEVTILCRPSFPHNRLASGVQVLPLLPARPPSKGGVLSRLFNYVKDSRKAAEQVAIQASRIPADAVLVDCFREYLAPLWTGPLKRLHASGMRIGVVAHDPVRDFVVGPVWWHRLCIRDAYKCMDAVLVHDATRVDFGGKKPAGLVIQEVPHGPYTVPPASRTRAEVREELGFGTSDQVILSFGQIRDGKNLDTFLRAMPSLPSTVKLLVAGRGDSGSQKPPAYYMDLAASLGVADRCHWLIRYIGDEEIGNYFAASDLCLLAYSKAFVSASGVLNTAVQFGIPILASGGEGPLSRAFSDYVLGKWIHDVNEQTLKDALLSPWPSPDRLQFSTYMQDHAWEKNARRTLALLDPRATNHSQPASTRG